MVDFKNTASAAIGKSSLGQANSGVSKELGEKLEKTKENFDASLEGTGTAYALNYTINVNPERLDLDPDSDTITLHDKPNEYLKISPDTVKVEEVLADGTKKPLNRFKCEYDKQTRQMTLVLPDSRSFEVTYTAFLEGELNSSVTISNDVMFEGAVAASAKSEGTYTIVKSKAEGSSETFSLNVRKLDKEYSSVELEGAEFELYCVTDLDRFNKDNIDKYAELWSTKKTDQSGLITWNGNDDTTENSLRADSLYYYIETEAPAGYELDDTPHYFVFKGTSWSATESKLKDLFGEDLSKIVDTYTDNYGSVTVYDLPKASLIITKQDAENLSTTLAGATFDLYWVDKDLNSVTTADISGAGVKWNTQTTDDNGEIVWGSKQRRKSTVYSKGQTVPLC